jgi:hypothetical protein
MVRFIKFLRKWYHCDCISYCVFKSGIFEHVNTSHIHDLAKFMFGFSIFWTYLWFSQFMLIWYANIPEEITFITRIEMYNLPFSVPLL